MKTQFGINRAHQLESAFCMQFAHAYTHKTFKMHIQLENLKQQRFFVKMTLN